MKLNDLAAPRPTKQIAKVFESYFGPNIKFDSLSSNQTRHLLNRVQGLLREHRSTSARHTSEQNPSYLKLVMMEQALTQRVKENIVAPPVGQTAQPAQAKPAVAGAAAKDPKLAAALKKSQAGQSLNPEEQKMVAGAAMMAQESRLRRAYKMLKESEVQQAQVVLAAQDMVDKMQGMLEDVSELQFKELPALVDSIKNQVGIDQATQFNGDASAALSGLMQNLQAAKQQLDQALGVVTGTAAPAAADAAAMGAQAGADMGAELGAEAGADMGAELGAEAGADMGAELGAEAGALDDLEADVDADEPAGAVLGRARR
jgi:hypothetical protein